MAGFTPPDFRLPENFSFHSIGPFDEYPVGRWSDALIKFLNEVPDEVFCLMLEDYWVTRPVNVDAVRMLHDYMLQFRNVLKMDLCADRLYAMNMQDYDTCGYLDLVKSHHQSPYHMSLMTGLWRKELLLRFLKPEESPWDIEIFGTPRVGQVGDDVLVLGTRQWPVRHILAYRGGDVSKTDLTGLKQADIQALHELEYV